MQTLKYVQKDIGVIVDICVIDILQVLYVHYLLSCSLAPTDDNLNTEQTSLLKEKYMHTWNFYVKINFKIQTCLFIWHIIPLGDFSEISKHF